jgi:hypothetical protein
MSCTTARFSTASVNSESATLVAQERCGHSELLAEFRLQLVFQLVVDRAAHPLRFCDSARHCGTTAVALTFTLFPPGGFLWSFDVKQWQSGSTEPYIPVAPFPFKMSRSLTIRPRMASFSAIQARRITSSIPFIAGFHVLPSVE